MLTAQGKAAVGATDFEPSSRELEDLMAEGLVRAQPMVYEDFLPVSAAGIFQSNLGSVERKHYAAQDDQAAFEAALGAAVHDEIDLYAQAQTRSIEQVRRALQASVSA